MPIQSINKLKFHASKLKLIWKHAVDKPDFVKSGKNNSTQVNFLKLIM